MQIIAIVVSLAVFTKGSDDSYFTDLLRIISRNTSFKSDLTELDESPEEFEPPANPTLNETFFCPITPGARKAAPANTDSYPWVARVVHSPDKNAPFLCTAVAVQDEMFITAARCTATAKCGYTSVLYNNGRLRCKAFVHPTRSTKQWFDDISIIVVKRKEGAHYWLVHPFDRTRPGPDDFEFLDAWRVNEPTNKVVGYVADPRNPAKQRLHELSGVLVSNYLCNRITRAVAGTADYFVPCYHPCTPRQHAARAPACAPRLAGLGHAVLDKRGYLLGLASWACDHQDASLPVGIAVMNSKAYADQVECAGRIVGDVMAHENTGQGLHDYCSGL